MKSENWIGDKVETVTYIAVILSAAMIGLSTVVVCLDVMLRKFASRPIYGVTEIVEYVLLYITFLAAAWLLKHDEHIKVELVYQFLPKKFKMVLDVFTSFIIIFVVALFFLFGFKATWDFYQRGVYNPTLLEFPKYIVVGCVPLGSLLMLLVIAEKAIRLFSKKGNSHQHIFGKEEVK